MKKKRTQKAKQRKEKKINSCGIFFFALFMRFLRRIRNTLAATVQKHFEKKKIL